MMMPNNTSMTPIQPFLLRAFFDWIVSNGLTPHIRVDTQRLSDPYLYEMGHAQVVTLDISPAMVSAVDFGVETLSFTACFDGLNKPLQIPVTAVLEIFAKENLQGVAFAELDGPGGGDSGPANGGRHRLRLVK